MGLPRSRLTTESKEKSAILVVVNPLTKIGRNFAVSDKIDAPSQAELLACKLVFKGSGFPESIVSDWGPQLTSKIWSAFCYHLQI